MAISAKRNAKIELTASAKGVAPGLNDARRQLKMFQREQAKQAKADAKDAENAAKKRQRMVAGAAGNVGGGVKSGIGALLGIDAAGGIAGMVSEFRDVEKEMTRFQIDAQLGADKMSTFRAEVMRVSNATGVSRQSLVEGAHAYQILTGDADGARESMDLFAKVAIASGSSMDEIAHVAGAMRMNARIDPKNFQEGFDVLLSMGHKGSVELRDFGSEVARLMPMVDNFGNASGMDKWTEMAAGIQGVRKEFGDVNQAATGFAQLMARLSNDKVAERLASHGVMVWSIDPKSGLHVKNDLFKILDQIRTKIKDPKVLGEVMGGRLEASRALNAIEKHWDEIIALKNEAQGSDQVNKDAATYLDSPTGKLERAGERIKNALASALTPEVVEAFANAIDGLPAHIQPIIDALSKVTAAVGWIYSLGQKIRGKLPGGDGHLEDNAHDVGLAKGDAYELERAKNLGWSPEEIANRTAAAKRNLATHASYNTAVDSIMGAESDDRSTPASIYAAMAAKYKDSGTANPYGGAYQAGSSYLKAAGYNDPVEREEKRLSSMSSDVAMAKMAATIAAAVSQVRINLDGNQISKGIDNSHVRHLRPGGH